MNETLLLVHLIPIKYLTNGKPEVNSLSSQHILSVEKEKTFSVFSVFDDYIIYTSGKWAGKNPSMFCLCSLGNRGWVLIDL